MRREGRKRGVRGDDDAGRISRERYRKKLNELLGPVDDEAFLQLVWAADALQSGRAEVARRFIRFPVEAESAPLGSKFHIPKWDLETLVNELLSIPKKCLGPGRNRILNCQEFLALSLPVNNMRWLENAESSFILRRMSVLWELPRIAYRQFPWQRGFFTSPQLYRPHFLFGGQKCESYFEGKWGISRAEFAFIGFAIHAAFLQSSSISSDFDLGQFGIDRAKIQIALDILTISASGARNKAVEYREKSRATAYQQGLLRSTPLIDFDARLRAPLPDLIIPRITDGIYYDLVDGPSDLRNEIASRFETYSLALLNEILVSSEISGSHEYMVGGRKIDSPDLILRKGEIITAVIECKAKKMTFDARFSENPIRDAEVGFQEIAKGVFQIWRYLSHIRRGYVKSASIDGNTCAAVVTLDSWLTASNDFIDQVRVRALRLAEEQDSEITEIDRRPVAFCPIEEVEQTLLQATEEDFYATLRQASEDRFKGWALSNVHQQLFEPVKGSYPFHDRMGEVLPWWDMLKSMRSQDGD